MEVQFFSRIRLPILPVAEAVQTPDWDLCCVLRPERASVRKQQLHAHGGVLKNLTVVGIHRHKAHIDIDLPSENLGVVQLGIQLKYLFPREGRNELKRDGKEFKGKSQQE